MDGEDLTPIVAFLGGIPNGFRPLDCEGGKAQREGMGSGERDRKVSVGLYGDLTCTFFLCYIYSYLHAVF